MRQPTLVVDIEKQIGQFRLKVELEAEPGILVLFGPSGAGKTQTLNAIAGLTTPDAGEIVLGSRALFRRGRPGPPVNLPARKRRIGYVLQDYALFPHLTVARNIAYGLTGWSAAAARERVRQLVGVFHLEGLEERRTWELSGGQQQRVALARALAANPEMLLLDEPFASLDIELRRALRGELRSLLKASPLPVLLVTHDREEALALADWVQVLNQGQPIARGRPLEVLGQPGQGRVARLVGVENLFRMWVESRNPRDGTMICVGDAPAAAPGPALRLEVPLDEPATGWEGPPTSRSAEIPPSPLGRGGQQGGQRGDLPLQREASEDSPLESAGAEAPGEGKAIRVGDIVSVGIRASDIILATEEPRGSSARNRLRGVVVSVELRPPGYEVTLDCGVPLRCHITGGALAEMQIRPGLDLWAVFKASSCFLVQEDPSDHEAGG